VWNSTTVDDMMHEVLGEMLITHRELFPPIIKTEEYIKKYYQCYRTFRISSDTRATEQRVNALDIDVVNRWRSEARKREGKITGMTMRSHYADLDILLQPFLRYTGNM